MRSSVFLALAVFAFAAQAQDPATREYCEATPQEREVADATAMMVPLTQITRNPDLVTYSIAASPYLNVPDVSPPANICPEEPFYNQPRATLGRTAFLIDSKRMVTAPHFSKDYFHPKNYAVVFGLRREKLPQGGCGAVNYQNIPAANVYFPPTVPDSYLYTSLVPGQENTPDYLYFELDRPVPNIKPLALRRSGAPDVGDPLLVVGHPDHLLAAKIGTGAYVEAVTPQGLSIGSTIAFDGSSGSPLYNLRKRVVETVVAQLKPGKLWTPDVAAGCYRLRPNFEPLRASLINNGPLSAFVDHVDPSPNEIQVWPQATVRHVRLPNGDLTNATSTFYVAPSPFAGPTAQTLMLVSKSHQVAVGNAVSLTTSQAEVPFTMAAGTPPKSINVTATASPTSCGIHDTEVRVARPDGEAVQIIPHRFELGMSDFEVTPNAAWSVMKLAAPYPTRTITVKNLGPIAATYVVASTKSWTTINGNASATLNLTPSGTSGATATVVLGVAANAGSVVPLAGSETALISVTPANSSCSARPAESIPVTFTNGIEAFTSTDTRYEPLPEPTGGALFGAVREITVDLSAQTQFTVADVNLNISFSKEDSGDAGVDTLDTKLRAVLVAPDGTSAELWNRNDAPASYINADRVLFDGVPLLATTLKLDDTATPPLTTQKLSTFNGRLGGGVWTVRLSGTAGIFAATPLTAQLVVTKAGQTSPMVFTGVTSTFDALPSPGLGQTFGTPVDLPIDTNAAAPFNVSDVDVWLGLYNESASMYYDVTRADTIIKLELIAPDLTTAVLWDRNNSTAAYQATEPFYYDGAVTPLSLLKLDDASAPPLGGNLLSTFNGHAGKGMWRLRIYGANEAWNVTPIAATLTVKRSP